MSEAISALFGKTKSFIEYEKDIQKCCEAFGLPKDAYLMEHQKKAVEISTVEPRWCFFHDTGTGKTLTAIEIIKKKMVKSLVVTKKDLVGVWLDEIAHWAPQLKATTTNLHDLWGGRGNLAGSTKFLNSLKSCRVGIVNYESFKRMYNDLVKARFQMVILDESSVIKNQKSEIAKKVTIFCKGIPYIYELTGTPAPNGEFEYFTQVRLVSDVFGRKYEAFRTRFFFQFGPYGWKLYPHRREEFLTKLKSCSHTVLREDVLDLPERTFNIREVALSGPEIKAYNEMKKHLIIEIEEKQYTAATSAVKLMKLREVTSGFIMEKYQTIENGVKVWRENKALIGKSKLDALSTLLEEIGNHQAVIWCCFNVEAAQIQKALASKCVRVDGTTPDNIRSQYLQNFKSGKTQYLLSKTSSLGHGHTWVNCQYMIFYSIDYNAETHSQGQDRIYRKGQDKPCTYYYLLATIQGKPTIDGVILNALNGKRDVLREVLTSIKGGI
uniref:Putative helicase n=1 Tax=viral metagenome TaxID=1070528 RepID=A0A6M3K4D6_9ZZZZ